MTLHAKIVGGKVICGNGRVGHDRSLQRACRHRDTNVASSAMVRSMLDNIDALAKSALWYRSKTVRGGPDRAKHTPPADML